MPTRQSRPDLDAALPKLVARLVESYQADERTHRIDRCYLPSRAAIVSICDILLELTYPGYIGRMGLTSHNIAYHVGDLLPRLFESLAHEIEQCLCFEREHQADGNCEEAACRARAEALATEFVERIPDVREALASDIQAAYDGDPAATCLDEIILAYPGVLAVTIFRYAHVLHEMRVPLMPRIMTEHAHQRTGIDIHPGATIGHSFFVDHGTGVVIGETCEIGDNVKIYQGVTLGAASFPKDERGRMIRGTKRHPTVGNRVTVYSNATILGGETVVGDGATVNGAIFLVQSVDPGHTVSMTPPVLRFRPPREPQAQTPPA